MTPADCDLRGLPFMPLDVVRLGDSDLMALTTGEEFKAAVVLWCKSWLQVPAASLPNDDRVLAHLSGAGARWKKVRPMALHGWTLCSDNRLYHPVVTEKALEAWKHRQQQRARANKRWGNATASDDGITTADATACPTAMQGTGTGTGTGTNDDADASSAGKRARRLPPDWSPSRLPDTIAALVAQWPPGRLERELDAFRDYWASRSKDAAKLDWDRTWHNRIRDQHDKILREARHANGRPSGANGHREDDGFLAALREVQRNADGPPAGFD